VKRVKEQMAMELIISEDVVRFVADKGFDKDYGARPIRRALQTQVEDVLAEAVLAGEVRMGDTVEVFMEGKSKVAVRKAV
jgi:ATP-dependent Clp protease ATP-binding subunit ClpC